MWRRMLNAIKTGKFESDDFIKRIRYLTIGEGMLPEGNIPLMDYAIKNLPQEGCVLEIGSYGGLSTNLIVHLLRKHEKNNTFFTCDAWIYEGYNDHLQSITESHIDGRRDITRSAYSDYMKNAFMNSVQFLSQHHKPFSFHLDSATFFENWSAGKNKIDIFGQPVQLGGKIGFAYIDGGHSYEVAWGDFINVASHLAMHGFILLDDSGDGQNFGSARMMEQIKKDKRFRVIAMKPNYLIQKTA